MKLIFGIFHTQNFWLHDMQATGSIIYNTVFPRLIPLGYYYFHLSYMYQNNTTVRQGALLFLHM